MSSLKLFMLLALATTTLVAQPGRPAKPSPPGVLDYIDDGEKSITVKDLDRHVSFLASDEMKGRLAGTPEAKRAAEYIRDHMKEHGLQPRGQPRKSYFYKFKLPGSVGHNVVGVLPGTHPALKKQYVVIGAHLDHAGLGMRGRMSRTPGRRGEVHNGADDNGSGSTGLLELVEAFSQHPTKRSLLFMAFSAEEWGLFGSKAFVKKPTVPLKSIALMVNLDMIGRSRAKYLFVGGVHTGRGLYDLLEQEIVPFGFDLEVSGGGPGPSDMSPFYENKVPVLFFTTGLHGEYHTPDDDVALLNLSAERDLLRLVYRMVRKVADAPKKPKWQKDDRQAMPQEGDRGTDHARVMLGVQVPRTDGGDGAVVLKVSAKGPAGRSGIKAGDVIVAIDEDTVASPLALRKLLGAASYNSTIKVKVRRGKSRKERTYRVKLVHW